MNRLLSSLGCLFALTLLCAAGNYKFQSLTGDNSGGNTPVITGFNTEGVVNVMNPKYGAKCDGSTDDTVAIQAASDDAFDHYKLLYFPVPNCRVTQLRWGRNAGGVHRTDGSVHVMGPVPGQAQLGSAKETILCREPTFNSGVCVDLTDAAKWSISNIKIGSEGAGSSGSCASTSTCPPRATVLWSETSFTPGNNSQIGNLSHSAIDNYGDHTLGGDYAIFDYGGEMLTANDFYLGCGAVSALTLSVWNTAGLASPFTGTSLATHPVSMTGTRFEHGVMDGQPGCVGVQLDAGTAAVSDTTFDGVYMNFPSGSPGAFKTVSNTGTIRSIALRDIRFEPQGASPPPFAVFGDQVQNIMIDVITHAPPAAPGSAPIQFNKTGVTSVAGALINFRPGDVQANYASPAISCASNTVGVVILGIDKAGGAPYDISCPGATLIYSGMRTPQIVAGDPGTNVPSLTSCGTAPALQPGSTNSFGEIITGTGTAACTVNFGGVFLGSDDTGCTLTDNGAANLWYTSTTAPSHVTFNCKTLAGAACSGGDFVTYHCIGY